MKTSFLCLIVILLPACSQLPTLPNSTDVKQLARHQLPKLPIAWQQTDPSYTMVDMGWLNHFKDPLLHHYIALALQHNSDLIITKQSIAKAIALSKQRQSLDFPTANLSMSANYRDKLEGNAFERRFTPQIQMDWDMDIWGENNINNAIASDNLLSTKIQLKYAQANLISNIVKNYVNAVYSHQLTQLLAERVQLLSKINKIGKVQLAEDAITEQVYAENIEDLLTAKKNLLVQKDTTKKYQRTLEVLIGNYPISKVAPKNTLPTLPNPPVGLPSKILERRWDIMLAERNILKQTKQIYTAKVAKLPSFKLTATLGATSSSLKDSLNPSNIVWNALSAITLPLFDGKKLQTNINIAEIDYKIALQTYKNIALNAFSEVENLLNENSTHEKTIAMLNMQFNAQKRKLKKIMLQYRMGSKSHLETLKYKLIINKIKHQLEQAKQEKIQTQLNLYHAVGGSFD